MHKKLSILLVALLVVAMLPTAAFAKAKPAVKAGLRPQYVVPADAYESDDTSAEAKVWGENIGDESVHTLTGADDEDWVEFSADETGQPFVFETQSAPLAAGQSWFDSEIQVWAVDPEAENGLSALDTNDDSEIWDVYGSTVFFVAPAPGTYYVQVYLNSPGDNGRYKLFLSDGISRRIGGANRYETAAKLADTMYSDALNPWGMAAYGPDGVILVNGSAFSDALSAGAWGAMGPTAGAPFPLLLTGRDTLPAATQAELLKLAQASWWDEEEFTVYVVGGTGAVSNAQVKYLEALPFVKQVVRIAGVNRFDTATKVADMLVDGIGPTSISPQRTISDTVFLVNGYKWPDGVAAGSLAGSMHSPILLSAQTTVTAQTRQWLADNDDVIDNVIIVGSPSAVDTVVAESLEASFTVSRIGGNSRYETAYLLAKWGVDNDWLDPSGLTLVTGQAFPDGLAAGPFAMLTNTDYYGPMPILLTPRGELADQVYDFWDEYGPTDHPSYIIGSEGAVSADAEDSFDWIWQVPMEPLAKR